ncbi:ATP-binding cassette domain-containing protein [Corynebacterium tapiri]|uniref:ATP-binding cassette domain-containing protein n=1 Tax=Corynebacterium tapiri TaxID=1448266 RepID=A0A5C4U6G7_9CORY|nr:ATP-binding cassette domain-containing protein [Corynebacterium tapiri]TNL99692.1 ATP-binding cassette domain-containing protein [Corynebacterium tapiri]
MSVHHRVGTFADGIGELAEQLCSALPNAIHVFPDAACHLSLLRATVIEEVAYGLEQQGIAPEQLAQRARRALELVDLADCAEKDPRTLSGGQTRRLALASVLAWHTGPLVLDRCFEGLDAHSRQALACLCRRWPEDVWIIELRGVPELGIEPHWIGGDHRALALPEEVEPSAPLRMVKSVEAHPAGKKRWWRKLAAEPVIGPIDIPVQPGAVTHLAGPNGAGKTSLLRALAGLDVPVHHVPAVLAFQRARDQVLHHTFGLMLASDDRARSLGLDPEQHPLDAHSADLRVAQVASVCGANREIVLLDEPDTGLDLPGRERVHRIIADALRNGAALVLTCHDEDFLAEVSTYAQVRQCVVRS